MLAVGLLLGLAACSGDDRAERRAEVQSSVFPSAESAADHEYVGLRAGQRAIRECMEAAGFDYVELDPGKDVLLQSGWYSGPDPAAHVAEFGYGISIGVTDEAFQGFVDPNDAILASLEPSLRDAWTINYVGTPDSPGCAAAGDVLPSGGDFQERFQRTFEQQIIEMQARIFADQRVVDADAAWAACMREHGFDQGWRYPQDPVAEIEERASELYAPGELDDPEALDELREFERAVAAADLQCPNNNFGGWQAFLDEIYREYEQEFFDQHEAEILRLADAADST